MSHKTQCVKIFYGSTGLVKDRNWSTMALVVTQLFQLFKSGLEKSLSERASK